MHPVSGPSSRSESTVSARSAMLLRLAGNTQGVISRQASGLSFDFPPGDGATYFAGTEDGLIHKCSVSYNEQYLETYHGHTAPVYRIRCSPFYGHLFLSCRQARLKVSCDPPGQRASPLRFSALLFAAANFAKSRLQVDRRNF